MAAWVTHGEVTMLGTETPVAVLHAGAMKTGTTYLQGKCYANREALAAAGVDLPGTRWRAQVNAVQDLLGMAQHDPIMMRRIQGAWSRYLDQAQTPDPISLLSMEFLSFADRKTAARAVTEIEGATKREAHLVLTVRDAAAVVPALWQTSVTSGGTETWPEFLRSTEQAFERGGRAGLFRKPTEAAQRFREALDIPRMLDSWAAALPAERVHVVVVPGPGADRGQLWRLFCEVLGIDPTIAPEEPTRANESLGYPSAELVRQVNEALALELPSDQRTVKVHLARQGLSPRRHEERHAHLDPAALAAAVAWNERVREAITTAGVNWYGDLADLPVEIQYDRHTAEPRQAEPSREELMAAAIAGHERMAEQHEKTLAKRLDETAAAVRRAEIGAQLIGPDDWSAASDPVAAAVADIALLCRSVIEVEREFKEAQTG